MDDEEIKGYCRGLWEKKYFNKSTYVYHGTSVLLLPYIKSFGLNPSALPKGIKRGIETLSPILKKNESIRSIGQLDLDLDMSKKGTCLTYFSNVLAFSAAPNLPAFLYELFNENHIVRKVGRDKLNEFINSLNDEEKRMCKVVWRFGRILRKKNGLVKLHILFNSEFLNYLGIPDYLNNFEIFYNDYMLSKINHPYADSKKDIVDYFMSDLTHGVNHGGITRPFYSFLGCGDPVEFRIKKTIPCKFIFIKVKNFLGIPELVNISNLDELKMKIVFG